MSNCSIDSYRLVMPPTLFTILQYPFTQLAYKILPLPVANGVISGAFAFCKSVHVRDDSKIDPSLRQMFCMIACTTRKHHPYL